MKYSQDDKKPLSAQIKELEDQRFALVEAVKQYQDIISFCDSPNNKHKEMALKVKNFLESVGFTW